MGAGSIGNILLGVCLLAALLVLLHARLVERLPFIPPAPRSHAIYNLWEVKRVFPGGKDDLPNKQPVEGLEGWRLLSACFIELCFIVLVIVSGIRLTLHEDTLFDQTFELFFSICLLLLWTSRFLPSPYRRRINFICILSNLVYLIIKLQSDILPLFLLHPKPQPCRSLAISQASLSAAILIAHYATKRVWYPVDPYAVNVKPSSEQLASPLSLTGTYSWLAYLIKARRRLNFGDLPAVSDDDSMALVTKKIGPRSDDFTLAHLFWTVKFNQGVCLACDFAACLLSFVAPLSMQVLLRALQGESLYTPWLFMIGIGLRPVVEGVVKQSALYFSNRAWFHIEGPTVQALFDKSLKIYISDPNEAQTQHIESNEPRPPKYASATSSRFGRIYNMMSSDIANYQVSRDVFQVFGNAIPRIVVGTILMERLIGWPAYVGAILSGLSCWLMERIMKASSNIQHRSRRAADERIGQTQEMLSSIRIVKYHGWESLFFKAISAQRHVEVGLLFDRNLYQAAGDILTIVMPRIIILVVLLLFTKVMQQDLKASVAFTLVVLFEMLQESFRRMARELPRLQNFLVSHDRILGYLQHEDEIDTSDSRSAIQDIGFVGYQDATLSWEGPENQDDQTFRLQNLNVKIRPGGLTVITGIIASGKTSFLMGLLGEMQLIEGKYHLPRKSGVALVPQVSWLLNDTIRENILFGSPYLQGRYQTVLDACALRQDLDAFQGGDMTEIGERGLTLSGGQQQRVSLARAVYSQATTLLMDDVFSALDASTARYIYRNCLQGEVLRSRTVVMITQQISLVRDSADQIIYLSQGRIIPEEAEEVTSTTNKVEAKYDTDPRFESPGECEVSLIAEKTAQEDGRLTRDEERAYGRVAPALIYKYLKYMGGLLVILGLSILGLGESAFTSFESIIFKFWVDSPTNGTKTNTNHWLRIYIGNIFIVFCFESAWTFGFMFMQRMASTKIHDAMLKSILHAPIRFFDTNPTGRILNRFSNDLEAVDRAVPYSFRMLFELGADIVLRLAVFTGVLPLFFIPLIGSISLAAFYGLNYLRVALELRRLGSVSASPMIAAFHDALHGMVIIRAFNLQQYFLARSLHLVDKWVNTTRTLCNVNRWLSVRMAFCGSLISAAVATLAILNKGLSPGLIGFSFALTYTFSFKIMSWIREYTEFEVNLASFQRAQQYIDCIQEAQDTPEGTPPASWPLEGDIRFEDLAVRYFEGGPQVLNKISFSVKSGERIAIVGRSGAGKSTIATTVLRFTEVTHGRIFLNGRDISTVNLESLRQRITFIPQDPTCFQGTVRRNLDPFGLLDDSDLESALQGSGLANLQAKSAISESSTLVSGTQTPIENGKGSVASDTDSRISSVGV